MKCKEIIESLEQKYAPDFAESWDNVGLLVGDKEKEVHKIFLALDVTDESLEMAIKEQADMIITHHPLIFSAMKKVTTDNFAAEHRGVQCGVQHMQNGLMNDDLHNIPHGSRLFWAPGAGQKLSK